MTTPAITLDYASPDLRRRAVWPPYFLEATASLGSNLLMVGIFFYTHDRYGWTPRDNLLLACGQGVVYIIGALLANGLSRRLGPRFALAGIYLLLAFCALGALLSPSPSLLVASLLAYVLFSGMNWPILEGLISAGLDAHLLSRRIGIYNLVWSGMGTVIVAVSGAIIDHWPLGIFILPLTVHLAAATLLLLRKDVEASISVGSASADRLLLTPEPRTPNPLPETPLLAQRTLALWLSRLALPSTFVVIYSLMAIMPSLPVMQPLTTTGKTLVGSMWLLARWLSFLALGATIWWHTRPRVLLLSAFGLLIAFLGTTLRPSALLGLGSHGFDLPSMLAFQILLGLCMGMIYTASLYFGMVLSEGSTEHGGYHEALIGLGSVLGPGAAAATQAQWPGNLPAGIAAVAGILVLSLLAALAADIRTRRRS